MFDLLSVALSSDMCLARADELRGARSRDAAICSRNTVQVLVAGDDALDVGISHAWTTFEGIAGAPGADDYGMISGRDFER